MPRKRMFDIWYYLNVIVMDFCVMYRPWHCIYTRAQAVVYVILAPPAPEPELTVCCHDLTRLHWSTVVTWSHDTCDWFKSQAVSCTGISAESRIFSFLSAVMSWESALYQRQGLRTKNTNMTHNQRAQKMPYQGRKVSQLKCYLNGYLWMNIWSNVSFV